MHFSGDIDIVSLQFGDKIDCAIQHQKDLTCLIGVKLEAWNQSFHVVVSHIGGIKAHLVHFGDDFIPSICISQLFPQAALCPLVHKPIY